MNIHCHKIKPKGLKKLMNNYCSICGNLLSPNDEDGICHLCKLSIIFNSDIYPDIDDFAC